MSVTNSRCACPPFAVSRRHRQGREGADHAGRRRLAHQGPPVRSVTPTAVTPLDLDRLLDRQERWRDKQGIAEHFSCGIRWIEERMAEGMPHKIIAGKAKFKVGRCEPWLDEHGFIQLPQEARR